MRLNTRLVLAVLSSLLEEAALAALVLWGLPRLGINIPLPVLIAMMAVLAGYSVFSYWLTGRALRRKPLLGLPDMVGSRGTVVRALDPDGLVKIKGELWQSRSGGGKIDAGDEVIVTGQEGLRLIVHGVGDDSSRRQPGG